MGIMDFFRGGGDEAENLDEEKTGEEEENGEEDDPENLDEQDDEQDGEQESGGQEGQNEDSPEDMDEQDPTQDGEGSLQDGPDGEKDPAQDGPGSKQDGPGQKEKENKPNGPEKGGGGMPGKLKDPWDPAVTLEIAKACGIPPIPIPYPCPECKKMSLYLDTWVKNGGRLTILLAYTVIMILATKTCPTKINDVVQQVHFLCLNYKCKMFHYNAFKWKFVKSMSSTTLDKRQWLFASPFPKMTVKEAMKIQKKVSSKNQKGGEQQKSNQKGGAGGIAAAAGKGK